MARYTATVETRRPRADVAAYLCDFSNTQDWDPGVVEAERLDHGPIGTGSRFRVVARFLGRRAELIYEIVRLDPVLALAFNRIGDRAAAGLRAELTAARTASRQVEA